MAHQIREVDASEGRGEPPSAEDDEPAKSATGDAFPTAVEVQAPECEGLQDEPVGSSTPIVVQASECEDPQVLSKDGSIAEEPAPAEAESESEEIESEEETPGAQQAESAHTLGDLVDKILEGKLVEVDAYLATLGGELASKTRKELLKTIDQLMQTIP
jgi:hypothetical protein